MTGRADTSRDRTRRSLRRWSGIAIIGVILVAATAAGFILYSTLALKAEAARSEIEAQLSSLTGLPVFVAGPASFTLLPRTHVGLTNIKVGPRTGDADAVMEIEGLVADLDLWEALWGRTRIERLTLVHPELLSTAGFIGETETSTVGGSSSDPALGPISRYIGAFLSRFGALRSLEIRDGVFRMAPGPGSLGVSNANLVVTWPSQNSSARMTGSYVWNGEPTEIGLKIASPLAFLKGASSAVDFTLVAPPLTASFDGEAAIEGAGSFRGALSVATPSLTRSIRWLGDPKAVLPEIGPLSLEATLDAANAKLNLRDAKVSVNGFSGAGALEVMLEQDKRPAIDGTLAFDRLDLTGFGEAVAPLPQTALDMQRRIPVNFIGNMDLDLRLSAADGAIGSLPFSDLAATVKFKDGVATVDLGDIAILGGQAQARVTVDSASRPAQATGVASFSGVDTASFFSAISLNKLKISGASDIHADYSMPVTSWADIARRNRIALSFIARNGTLSGFDPQVFAGETVKPLAPSLNENALPFQKLRATLKSEGPLIDVDKIEIAGSFGLLSASGSISAATRRLDLSGMLEEPAASTAGEPAPVRGFRMQGIWPNPAVTGSLPTRPM